MAERKKWAEIWGISVTGARGAEESQRPPAGGRSLGVGGLLGGGHAPTAGGKAGGSEIHGKVGACAPVT